MALLKKDGAAEGLTIISEEASFHGLLTVKGSLRVDGSVDGDITEAAAVSVGKSGHVKGNIAAESLSVAGEVEGDVLASQSVEILSQGRLRGNIRTKSLKIEEGASFDGGCAMEDGRGSAPRKTKGSVEPVEQTS
ncbi:MAG: bactofilin family protein [Elusimicrobiota bacterium]